MRYFYIIVVLAIGLDSFAQSSTDWAHRPWSASWITAPCAPATEFTVVHFGRVFQLAVLPDSLPVMVSADNRYQLFVNGKRVGMGPARSDRMHWRYETYDLLPHLQTGANMITATVWNYGIDRPWAQESYRTAFLLQPRGEDFAELQTDIHWSTRCNQAYAPITGSRERLGSYIVTGPQLRIDGNQYPWGMGAGAGAVESGMQPAVALQRANPRGTGTEMYWPLVARQIPPMELRQLPPPQLIRDARRVGPFTDTLLPANTRDSFLFDVGHLTNAFFKWRTAGGGGAKITVTYAESLIDENGRKGHRDSLAGKHILGVYDEYLTEGGERSYTTLWFRTARYLQVSYETADEPLRLRGLVVEEIAYPFEENGTFTSPDTDSRIADILEVGWRTARLCAQEIYVDCPYYEQLQYAGDTRIQALISLYVSGDARLMRKAILLFDDSRMAEGLTMSRYPDHNGQVIPPYSLMWVMMVYDYLMHTDDEAFVQERLDVVRAVLGWYHRQQLENGLIGPTPHWNYVDWTPQWPWDGELRTGGVPPLEGGSSIISGQYAMTLRAAGDVFSALDLPEEAATYTDRAGAVTEAIKELCWDASRGLLADTPAAGSFSQHANIMGILNDGLPVPKEKVLLRILEDSTLTQSSAYFDFYLAEALRAAGRADLYPGFLDQWRGYLEQGFTTYPEKPGESRSDCHAWSSSPNYHLPSLVAGIRPASAGFATVKISPAEVTDFGYSVVVPTPRGEVKMICSPRDGKRPVYKVAMPAGVTGEFNGWGLRVKLVPGEQLLEE